MNKYINADKFKIPKGTVDDIAERGVLAIYDLIDIQPSADVVEVVMCKDCKYRGKGLPYCAYFGKTDFCSKGERRT